MQKDLTEVKSFHNPPVIVKHVVEAVTLLLEQPVEGKSDWRAGRKLLGSPNLAKRMEKFDPKDCYLDSAQSAKSCIEPYPYALVRCISSAASNVYSWCVKAIEDVESSGGKQRDVTAMT